MNCVDIIEDAFYEGIGDEEEEDGPGLFSERPRNPLSSGFFVAVAIRVGTGVVVCYPNLREHVDQALEQSRVEGEANRGRGLAAAATVAVGRV